MKARRHDEPDRHAVPGTLHAQARPRPVACLGRRLRSFCDLLVSALPVGYPEQDLQSVVGIFADPAGRLLTGPGYGFDTPSYERLIANGYGLYFLLLSALMSLLLVVRHTRVEEQTGRAELVRANAIGRHAPLTAALVMALITNGAVTLVIAVLMMVSGFAVEGSLLFAASVGAGGLAFAGVAALAAQLTQFSRAAAGMAGAVLGAAFVIRAGGDMAAQGGTTLSWLSPLGWPQQTAPFVLDRWWPLALNLVFAGVAAGAGFALSVRRDFGAGMLATRTGSPRAAGWLRSPVTLAFRLERASIIAWCAGLAVSGALYGLFTESLLTAFDSLPATLEEVFGTSEDIVAGYLSYMSLFMAYFAAVYAILAVHGLRKEETVGRADPVLAAPVSRWAWLGSNLLVTALGVPVLLAVTGAATGLGAALVTGEASYIWQLTWSHLNHAPGALVLLAIAVLLFGAFPRVLGLTWALLAYGVLIGTFGPLIDPPEWVYDLSPFEHAARVPLEAFTLLPLVVLCALAGLLSAIGLLAFRLRDIKSA